MKEYQAQESTLDALKLMISSFETKQIIKKNKIQNSFYRRSVDIQNEKCNDLRISD